MLNKQLAQNNVTVTVRVPFKTVAETDRLAVEKGVSRNQMFSELIETGVAVFKDMTPIQNAINTSKGFFDDLQLDTLAEKLNSSEINFYGIAYLANKLTIEQRTELFKKMGFDDEQNEAYTIDRVLAQSYVKEQKAFNLYQLANNLTITLTEFGREYLSGGIGDEGVEKLKQIKPNVFEAAKVVLSEEGEDDDENRPSLPEAEVK